MKVNLNIISEYWPFAKSEIQRNLAYRLSFFMNVLGGILQVIIIYYLWLAIFNSSGSQDINGFSRVEMVTYIFISFITSRAIAQNIDDFIGFEVKHGDVAMNLIRPIDYMKRVGAISVGNLILQTVIIFIPLWITFIIFRFFVLGEALPSIFTLMWFFLSLLLSFIILFLMNFCFGLTSFFVTYIWGVQVCKNALIKMLSGEIIPLVFFPVWLQSIFKILPFGSLNYTPVMIYMEKYKGNEVINSILIQLAWVIVLYLIMKWCWKKAILRLTIMGG